MQVMTTFRDLKKLLNLEKPKKKDLDANLNQGLENLVADTTAKNDAQTLNAVVTEPKPVGESQSVDNFDAALKKDNPPDENRDLE